MQGSETAEQVYAEEGSKTMGVWLPLALARIYQMLEVLARMWSSHPEKVKTPSISKVLGMFFLPVMSKSMESAEEERKAMELFNSVLHLKEELNAC